MSEKQEDAAVPAIQQALLRAPPGEAQLLMGWVRGLRDIAQSELRGRRKLAAQLALLRDSKAAWPLVKVIGRALKIVAWDARSWKLRLGVMAVVATFVAVGNAGACIVPLEGGIGLPLWVLVGSGGVLVGLLADLIQKKTKKPRTY